MKALGLFDDYFDPNQFQDSGGLFGRLLSLHPELDFSSSGADSSQDPFSGLTATPAPPQSLASQIAPDAVGPSGAPVPAFDPAAGIATSNLQMPQAATADNSQPSSVLPEVGARLGAAFQGWAQTPVGSPFAALANGINAFNKTSSPSSADAQFIGPPPPTPDVGDRIGAAFQNWAQTPVGSPFAAIANGINGFNSGQASIAPATSSVRAQTPDNSDRANVAIQNPQVPFPNLAQIAPLRRPPTARRWPG
jgi:hypothetical protein